jgi:hypothetical protein
MPRKLKANRSVWLGHKATKPLGWLNPISQTQSADAGEMELSVGHQDQVFSPGKLVEARLIKWHHPDPNWVGQQ